jgi:hypothetical protein
MKFRQCVCATIVVMIYMSYYYGKRRLGSRGNIAALRMLPRPRKSMTTLSSPTPPPPWGRAPCLKLST